MAKVRLYDWGPSPFCLKVRAVLDYKGIEYERINVLGSFLDFRRRSQTGKVPALELDGELIHDSTDIVLALEARFPNRPVIPSDPYDGAICHVIEDWADEALYFINLYYQWVEPDGRKLVGKAFRGPLGRIARAFYQRRILRQLQGQGTLRKTPEHIRNDLDRELDAIDALLAERKFLLGERPFLCDFALAAQLVYLERTPVGSRALAGRAPSLAFMARMKVWRTVNSASP
jgi:glutathione S-transferase